MTLWPTANKTSVESMSKLFSIFITRNYKKHAI